MVVRVSANELRRHAYAMARFAHAAFKHVTRAEILADLLDVDRLTLVGEGRVARDNREGAPAGEQRDDVLGDAVSEKFLLGVIAKICEGQHRNGAVLVEIRRCRGYGWGILLGLCGRCAD